MMAAWLATQAFYFVTGMQVATSRATNRRLHRHAFRPDRLLKTGELLGLALQNIGGPISLQVQYSVMAQFQPAFEFMMSHEDPGLTGVVTVDSGGKTRYGISQKAFPELDIENLSIEQAANIYRNNYWFPMHGPDTREQVIANKLLDMAVNMGVRAATVITQKACGDAGNSVVADGQFGMLTLISVNNCDADTLLDCLRSRSKDHYCRIAAANPDEGKYLNGWLSRAEA